MSGTVITLAGERITTHMVYRLMGAAGLEPMETDWLSTTAIDVYCDESQPVIRAILQKQQHSFFDVNRVDWIAQSPSSRRKKLLITDMDSTIIQNECIDEIADELGLKMAVAKITEAAMNGQIDFETALRERVRMLKGLAVAKLNHVYESRIRLTPGAEALAARMSAHNAMCVIVSGGFTFFTEKISSRLGFHFHHANVLEITDGKLTGNVLGEVIDKTKKLQLLDEYAAKLKISPEDILALGDGANDIPMLQKAGLGIAYHAKASVYDAIPSAIRFTDLRTALYAQGYRNEEV